MRALWTTCLSCVGLFLIQLHVCGGEPKHEGPGWKLLHKRTGKWVERIFSGTGPKKVESEIVQTGKWILDGRYLELRGKGKGDYESLTLVTHDPKTMTYKLWFYDSGGGTSEWLGKLDPSGTKIHWKGQISDGSVSTASWSFTGKDAMEWESTVRDRAGKIIDHMEAKTRRMKK